MRHGLEDVRYLNLFLERPPSGGSENIVTAVDVFSRYPFGYTGSTPTALNSEKVTLDIMTWDAYPPQ